MGRPGWNASGLPVFLSERARRRAPDVLAYAAITGGAMLVSPSGEVVLFVGASADADVERVALRARALGGAAQVVSFSEDTACVHAGPVCRGWMLCILSTVGAFPGLAIERLRRASVVLRLALADEPARGSSSSSGGSSGSGGAPAELFAFRTPPARPS